MARRPRGELRKDVREAIEQAWPDGVIEMPGPIEESWFLGVEPKLRRALRRIPEMALVHERGAEGADPDEDPPSDIEPSRSYHLFFLSPAGEAFSFETEA